MVAGRIHADAGTTVTTEQLDFYHRESYLHLRGVLPSDLLSLTEYVLSRWVDETVAQWLGEGRIVDRRQDLDFGRRLVQVWHDAGRPKYSRSPRRDLVSPEMYRNFPRNPPMPPQPARGRLADRHRVAAAPWHVPVSEWGGRVPRTARCRTDRTRCAGCSTSATEPPTMSLSRAGDHACRWYMLGICQDIEVTRSRRRRVVPDCSAMGAIKLSEFRANWSFLVTR